jgi:hypothetical protein
MSKTNIDEVKLGGARRKNGHKSNCSCHICENMKKKASRGGYTEEIEKKNEYINGGSNKKNGHRKDCKCPICKNMINAKKGGKDNTEPERQIDFEKELERRSIQFQGGKGKKSNGHKNNCMCPICKNMKNAKKGGKDNAEPERQIDFEKEQEQESIDFDGGKRKKSNGHKDNCMCPICKNMRKLKKGGEEPDVENQIGDIEEGGIKASDNFSEETKASDEEYDMLDSAERGEYNAVGGTRKHKRGGKKWGGSKRHSRRKPRHSNRSIKNRSRRHH